MAGRGKGEGGRGYSYRGGGRAGEGERGRGGEGKSLVIFPLPCEIFFFPGEIILDKPDKKL